MKDESQKGKKTLPLKPRLSRTPEGHTSCPTNKNVKEGANFKPVPWDLILFKSGQSPPAGGLKTKGGTK